MDATTLATEIVDQAFFAMINDIRETGATVIAAEPQGALYWTYIQIDKKGADVDKIEEAVFNNTAFAPLSLEDKGDRWVITGSQLWRPRKAEAWTKEEREGRYWYDLPSLKTYIG